jgi:cellulose synthase operon protein YhjQ
VKIIAVVSAKGGVGKTSISANVSAALARMGRTVLGVDLDPQNSLRLHFGVSPQHFDGLARASLAGANWRDSILLGPSGDYVLPFGQVNEEDRQDFEEILRSEPTFLRDQLRSLNLAHNALVILDTPPGPSVYLRQALSAAHIPVIVVLADAASYATIPMIVGLIEQYSMPQPHFVDYFYLVNQVDRSRQLAGDVADVIGAQLQGRQLGVVHLDQSIPEGLACNQDVLSYDPHSRGAHDIMECAAALDRIVADQSGEY